MGFNWRTTGHNFISFFASVSESSGDTVTSPTSENMDAYKDQEEKIARGPLQEHVFAECSRERILGLLAAMLPATKPVTTKIPVQFVVQGCQVFTKPAQ